MIKLSSIKKEHTPSKTLYIDLNCDYGEGFGVFQNANEEKLIEYVSSINIPCGGHAGDPLKIYKALIKAKALNLSIGAHIGYPDLSGFGYREMNLSFEELQAMVLFQIGALKYMCNAYGLEVNYVRPHGALYKQIATDPTVAISLANAMEQADKWLILVGPGGESLNTVKKNTKIRVAAEIILNKEYDNDGNILFDEPVITDKERILEKASKLIKENQLTTQDDSLIEVAFNTIHFDSSSELSVEIAKNVRSMFKESPTSIPITLVGDNALY